MKQFLLPILALLLAVNLLAQDAERVTTRTRIAKQSATTGGDRGLFTVPSAETLNKGQFSFGLGWNNTDRTPRDLDVNSFPLYVSVGVNGRLTAGAVFETQRQVTARNPSQTGFYNSLPFAGSGFDKAYGDTVLFGKFRIQRRRDNISGISLKGMVKLGTADPDKGLGTGRTDAGADLIFTTLLPWSFVLHSTIAYTATSDGKEPFPIGLKDELRSGIGVAWPASGALQGIFEYATLTYVGAGSSNASKNVQNPSDIAGGLRYLMLDQGITIDAGYRTNSKFDFSFPGNRNRHGFTLAVAFTRPVRPPASNRFPVVALETDLDEIPAGGSAAITATGYDADNDILTYTWSASGGRIVGSGEKVTFNAAGVAPGKYTIRATVNDGRGGTATSTIELTVRP